MIMIMMKNKMNNNINPQKKMMMMMMTLPRTTYQYVEFEKTLVTAGARSDARVWAPEARAYHPTQWLLNPTQ